MTEFEQIARSWEEEVLSGARPACQWTHKAILRQRRDLLRQGNPDFPYVWRPDDGAIVIDFISCLTHIRGEHAGKNFILSPWQTWMILTCFSWKRTDNQNLRRFRRLFLEAGKSSGKTAMSSALLLYLAFADGEGGAECVSAARASSQARQCFDFCRDTLRANRKICAAFSLTVLQHSIVQKSSASTLIPVSSQGKTTAGKILHGAAIDELWAHRSRECYEEISLGCDKRQNSLLFSLGHAGEDLHSVGYELHVTATKLLNDELSDEKTLALIFSGEGYDWKVGDDAILAANPNAGVSSYLPTIREARDRALITPALQPAYKSHALVLWDDGETAKKWLTPAQVGSCKQPDLEMNSFRLWAVGEHSAITQPDMLRNFVCGIQRTSLQEPACVCYCCKGYLEGAEHFYLFPTYCEPEANDDEKLADAVLGNFRNHLGFGVTLNSETGFKIKALAHDAYIPPSARFEKNGINTLEFHKTAKTFSPVMDWLMSLLLSGRIHFSDDTLAAHLLGVEAKRDLNANLFPRRSNPDKTIDAALAAFYALRLAMVPSYLDPPEQSDVKVTFISDDGSVRQNGPDGTLVTVMGPLGQREGIHPGDAQGMLR